MKKTALIIYSNSTKNYAEKISKRYKNVKFLKIFEPPTEKTLKIRSRKDVIIGIGGGSVIDTAKIIAKKRKCVAIPTTASGAAVTSYATVWGKKKISITTQKPILRTYKDSIKLPFNIEKETFADALSHAIESFWSRNATKRSIEFSKKAISCLKSYLLKEDHNVLVEAGILAGKAIVITKTNIIHAISYPITINYKISHGMACSKILPAVVEFIDYKPLPKLFDFNSTAALGAFLEITCLPKNIKNFNYSLIAKEAMLYPRLYNGPKTPFKGELELILRKSNER